MIVNPKTSVVFPERHKNTQKTRRSQVERFMTKKAMAIAVWEVLSSFAITQTRLNLRLPCPNFLTNCIPNPLIGQGLLLFFLTHIGWGLPKSRSVILIPLS
jgi:hypothetical protein